MMKLSFKKIGLLGKTRTGLSRAQGTDLYFDWGFTLVELVTVLVILAVLLGVGIPTYMSWIPGMNLRSAVRDIKSNMELAKSTAIRENTSCALVFDTSTDPDSYTVFIDNVTTNLSQDVGETVIKRVDIPKNVTMTGAVFDSEAAVGFNSRGIPYKYNTVTSQTEDLAGDGFVTLENTKNNYRRVKLTIVGVSRIQRSDDGSTWEDD